MFNPFRRAEPQLQPIGDTSYFPPAPAPVAQQGQATSRQNPIARSSSGYSPLRDPEGPLARAGWIGALMATGPSRSEYLADLEKQQQLAIGEIRGKAYKKLGSMVQQGLDPQSAFLQFMQTPEGMEFITRDPDPNAALKGFLEMSSPAGLDPADQLAREKFEYEKQQNEQSGALRQDVFGQPQGGAPVVEGDPNADPNAQGTVITSQQLRDGARKLAAAKDNEGARLALAMAEEQAKLEEEGQMATTDELKEYAMYEKQEKEAGRKPMSWYDYKVKITQEGRQNINVNTAASAEDERRKAIMDMDKQAATEAAAASAQIQKALPVLTEMERISDGIDGGYAGQLAPTLAAFASTFGLEVDEKWSDAEKFKALTQQLMPLVRQPGQVSNFEMQIYASALPNLLQSKEGRKKLTQTLRKMGERAVEVSSVYRQYIGMDELPAKIAEVQGRPLFSDAELKEMQAMAEATPQQVQDQNTRRPAIGDVIDNHRYLGGDPNAESSWEELK